MAQRIDPYAVLQVVPTADQEVVKAAYRALARRYHPDASSDPEDGQRMVQLNAAWEMVGDPSRRAVYDRARGRAAETHRPSPESRQGDRGARSAPPGHPSRASGAPSYSASAARSNGTHTGRDSEHPQTIQAEPPSVGPPPGRASGSVIDFGRYRGWSVGEIARVDANYLEWLKRTPVGRRFVAEIDRALEPGVSVGAFGSAARSFAPPRRGWLARHR